MLGFLSRRVAMAFGTVAVAAVFSFLLMRAIPGSPGAIVLGPGADPAAIRQKNTELGWYDPLLTQFGDWARGLLRGDLGTSIVDGHPIWADLAARLPVTVSIAAGATLLSGVLGTALGVAAAVRRGPIDRLITTGSGIGLSLPAFWVGILLVYGLSIRLGVLPATGYVDLAVSPGGWLRSLTLPIIALAVGAAAVVARQARTSMVEALAQEHMRTLRATGLSPWRLWCVHGLRYAGVPVVSVLGIQFVALFSGSIIVEQLFALPGIGQATATAISTHDFPAVQGVVVVATVVVVVTNLLLDLLVAALDPKVRAA